MSPWRLLWTFLKHPLVTYRAMRQGYLDGYKARTGYVGHEHVTDEERAIIQQYYDCSQ
jgi:hypothetical protein